MIDKYIIDKIKDLPIEQVAEDLGLTVTRHKTRCPFHDDTRPSLTFNIRKNKYRCYVCDARGGVIDLTMHELNLNFIDACKWLGNKNGIYFDDDQKSSRWINIKPTIRKAPLDNRHSTIDIVKPDVEYLSRLMCQPVLNTEAQRFLFQERKLNREVIHKLGISSISYSCPMSSSPKPTYFDGPALLIPYRDIDGNLMSVQSRYLGTEDKPRFRFPKGSHCSIFNLPVLKECKPLEPVFITEGVTDCLAMLSAGFKAIAIPSATLLSESDKQQLLSLSSSLSLSLNWHMYPDKDEPGEKLFLQLHKLLSPSTGGAGGGLHRHNLPEGFKDVGQYYSFIHKDDKLNS